MKPTLTAVLTVESRDGRTALVVALPSAEDVLLCIPLDESASAVRNLVRQLAGLILAAAHREVGRLTASLTDLDH